MEVIDGVDAPNKIEARRRKRHIQQIALQDSYLRRCARARGIHMCRREIDADDLPCRFSRLEEPMKRLTRAASRVEYAHPGPQAQTVDESAQFGLRERIEQLQFARVVPRRRITQQAG